MSHCWYFSAFSQADFDKLLRGGRPDLVEPLMQVWRDYWGEEESDESGEGAAMAKRIATQGLTYDGLDDQQSQKLDAWVRLIFSGDWAELPTRPLNDGLGWQTFQIVDSANRPRKSWLPFMGRREPVLKLPLFATLDTGRRLGRDVQPGVIDWDNWYVVLTPDEVKALRGEADQIISVLKLEPGIAAAIGEEVRDALAGAGEGTPVFGHAG